MISTTLIDLRELATLLDASGDPAAVSRVVVLDCRFDLAAPDAGRQAYVRAHIPGAHYTDLNQDLAGPIAADSGRHPLPAADALAKRFRAFGIGAHTQVVVYDAANGSFAARAWWLLRWLGHTQVAVLDGGFQAWLASGGATEAGAERAPPVTASPVTAPPVSATAFNAAAVATTAEVLDGSGDPARLLVDARAAERFAGVVEPIDAVAGHVPGAVNHPFGLNLDASGRFLPPAELRRRWQERLGATAPQNVIVMCGSGVTACHNLLALEVAGLAGAKLYAGSWSEWIRDPDRPVAHDRES
jgi:thiosulfate/3-mercaptopyruvate sulfurtransferase